METISAIKIEMLKFIRDYNSGKEVAFPAIDRKMLKKDIFGHELKALIDNYVEENLLIWTDSLSLQITEEGRIFLIENEIKHN